MFKQIFTPKEASQRLPLIKGIVADILEKAKELRLLAEEHEGKELPPQGEALQADIEGLMEELEGLGCFYKGWDFEIGLVDFPALIDGKEVFLCWRSDEPSLRWYHGISEGYAGRTLIPEKLLAG